MKTSSVSRHSLISVAAIFATVVTCIPNAFAADDTSLQAETPKADMTPMPIIPPTAGDPQIDQVPESRIHRLQVNKSEMHEGADTDEPSAYNVQISPGTRNIQIGGMNTNGVTIRIQSFHSKVVLNSGGTTPLGLLQAMMGFNNKTMRKAYAECDTGYGVCGVALSKPLNGGYAYMNNVFPTMPAQAAGILPGDVVISVNGKSTKDIPYSEVWDWFTGMPGTPVTLVIRRKGDDDDFAVTISRMDIGHIPDFATRAEFLTLFRRNGVSKFFQQSYQSQ